VEAIAETADLPDAVNKALRSGPTPQPMPAYGIGIDSSTWQRTPAEIELAEDTSTLANISKLRDELKDKYGYALDDYVIRQLESGEVSRDDVYDMVKKVYDGPNKTWMKITDKGKDAMAALNLVGSAAQQGLWSLRIREGEEPDVDAPEGSWEREGGVKGILAAAKLRVLANLEPFFSNDSPIPEPNNDFDSALETIDEVTDLETVSSEGGLTSYDASRAVYEDEKLKFHERASVPIENQLTPEDVLDATARQLKEDVGLIASVRKALASPAMPIPNMLDPYASYVMRAGGLRDELDPNIRPGDQRHPEAESMYRGETFTEQQSMLGTKAQAGLTAFSTAMTVGDDPALIVDIPAFLLTKTVRGITKGVRAIKAVTTGMKDVEKIDNTVAGLLKHEGKLKSARDELHQTWQASADAGQPDAAAARKVMQMETRIAEAEVLIAAKRGDLVNVLEPKAPLRRDPGSIPLNDAVRYEGINIELLMPSEKLASGVSKMVDAPFPGQPRVLSAKRARGVSKPNAMRRVMALEHASTEAVEKALQTNGIQGMANYTKRLRQAIRNLRGETGLTSADDDFLRTTRRLPSRIQKHLDALGYGHANVMRMFAAELDMDTLNKTTQFAHPRISERASLLGMDDGAYAGDAAKRLALGADLSDVRIHGLQIPEHVLSSQGEFPAWTDDFMLGSSTSSSIKGTRLKRLNNGLMAVPDADMMTHQYGRVMGGLVAGASHLRLPQIVRDMTSYVTESGTKALGPVRRLVNRAALLRQPTSALSRDAYTMLRAHHGAYVGTAVAEEGYLADMLRGLKFVKPDRLGRIKPTAAGREAFQGVNRVLDMDADSPVLARGLNSLTDEQRQLYTKLRSHYDEVAASLGLEAGIATRHIVDHVLPLSSMVNGHRPLEFVGLPVSTKLGVNRLRGVADPEAAEDLLDTFQVITRGKNRKIYMEPMYEKMRLLSSTKRKEAAVLRRAGKPYEHLQREANYLEMMRDNIMGKPSSLDDLLARNYESIGDGGKSWHKLSAPQRMAAGFSSLLYASLLSLNPKYFVQNLFTAILNPAAKHGGLHTLVGLAKTVKMGLPTEGGRALKQIVRNSGVTDEARYIMQPTQIGNEANSFLEKLEKAVFMDYPAYANKYGLIEQSEGWNRGLSMHVAMSQRITETGLTWAQLKQKGLHRAIISESVQDAEAAQHMFGWLGRSPVFERTLGPGVTQLLTQFLSFPWKQGEFLVGHSIKDPGFLLRYLGYSGFLQRIASQGGMDVASSVGLGPANPFAGGLQTSPGADIIEALVDWGMSLGDEDPEVRRRANKRLQDSVQSLDPIVRKMKAHADKLETLRQYMRTGQGNIYDRRGQLSRIVTEETIGKDALPLLLNMRAKNDVIEQERRKRLSLNKKKVREGQISALEHITKLYDEGRMEEASSYQRMYEETYRMRFSNDPRQKYIEARVMTQKFRDFNANKSLVGTPGFEKLLEVDKSQDYNPEERKRLLRDMQ